MKKAQINLLSPMWDVKQAGIIIQSNCKFGKFFQNHILAWDHKCHAPMSHLESGKNVAKQYFVH